MEKKISKQKVVIIIPTYNEIGNISSVVKSIAQVKRGLTNYNFIILFVDDNSPDGTAKEIARIIKSHPFVKILKNKRKGGLGAAYKKGMRYALDKFNPDIIFQFDADLSHDPTKIPLFLKEIENGADLVLGARYLAGGGIPSNWPLHRKFLSYAGNIFIRTTMLNFAIHDWTTGYRAITRRVVEKISPTLSHSAFNGYTYQIGFLVKSIQAGFKVGEVPFHFVDRTHGESKLGAEYIFNTLRYIMKVRIQEIINHRLFKFAVTGGIGALIQIAFLQIYRSLMPFQVAFFLAIETAIISNFIFSNLWTFADRKLKAKQVPGKFVAFNLASGGSILIQQVIAILGERFIGLYSLFTLPIIKFAVDTGTMFAVTGILVGMFWNFFAYSKIIWKKK
jgi:dolichol-phosphate mannosyltransferase